MADVYKQSFKQNYTNNIELSIFNCGLERCAPGQTWGPGIRDHYLIHLVVSGKGVFEVGGRSYEVVPGDLFFARPSQLIRYTADEAQPWEYARCASALGMTEGSMAVAVHRLRHRFRSLIREEGALTVPSAGEIDEEMRHLFRVLTEASL